MTQQEYELMVQDFIKTVDLVRLEAYAATGYEWIVVPATGGFRSIQEQHKLYAQPTDGIDNDKDGKIDEADEKVTRADGGKSPHNFNLARDIVPLDRPKHIYWTAPKKVFKSMADIAVANGLTAGFYFRTLFDPPHIEHKDWKKVQTAWKNKEIICG